MRVVTNFKVLALVLLAVFCVAAPSRTQDTTVLAPVYELRTDPHPLSRVAFIGASVSAGFGNARELKVGRSVKLGGFFEQMLLEEGISSEVYDFGSNQFFLDPLDTGKQQIEKASAINPTLIVGIDYLFWYAFGYPRMGNPRRTEGLRMGLKRLDSIDCHLIVGDLPNVDHALTGSSPLRGGHPILRKGQIPGEQERIEMNKLIHEWASKKPNVEIFPLDKLMKQMVAGDEMELQGNTWKVEKLDHVLQSDLLHPKVRGSVWVAMHVAQASVQLPGVESADFNWDEAKIRERIWSSLEGARDKQAKLDARRKARRAKLDRKKAEVTKGL
ncbi:MAG: hypothetical protein GY930_20040 [bacterium]|nr:hypothetical protein [bacterium]